MKFIERKKWSTWVTPKDLRNKKVHRWCVFPHSFTSELVHGLIEEWRLTRKDKILDPFCGAGTTLLAAKEKGVSAVGYDLSPFAVFASKVKVGDYIKGELINAWSKLENTIELKKSNKLSQDYPDLIKKALPNDLLVAFDSINCSVKNIDINVRDKHFFRMALLAILPNYSRAVATGGWLKWVYKKSTAKSLLKNFEKQITLMLDDVTEKNKSSEGQIWKSKINDARLLPDAENSFSAVITSPPYPNRHDYTRVFSIELMFGFLNWEETRDLRYQSFESHPEARPKRPDFKDYTVPNYLGKLLDKIRATSVEDRIIEMINGYFIDLHLSLREARRVCKNGANIAFVLGNVQYGGVRIMVDKLTAEIGENLGLKCKKIIVARYRGNSAQQMSKYGRRPSRESIIIFKNNKYN